MTESGPIKVREIPYLLARACLPHEENAGEELVEIFGKSEPHEHPSIWRQLEPDDLELLARIWSGLPQPNEVDPQSFLWAHIPVFENSPERPSWDIRWAPTRGPSIEARKSFQRKIEKDIRAGVLLVRDPVTLISAEIYEGFVYFISSLVVTFAEFREYAKQFEIMIEAKEKTPIRQGYLLPACSRLLPRTLQFSGGRITNTDKLTLNDAAKMASTHAGADVTPNDFLRAAANGEIRLLARAPRTTTMQPCREKDKPLHVPEGSLPDLPLSACNALVVSGVAQWRTVERVEPAEIFGGELCRFTCWELPDCEPDFVITPQDCRVLGMDVHALADAFISSSKSEGEGADEVSHNLVGFRAARPEAHKTIINRKSAVLNMKAERRSLNTPPLTHDQKKQWLRDNKVLPDMLIPTARDIFGRNPQLLRVIEWEIE